MFRDVLEWMTFGNPPAWHDDAACKDVDPEIFFPDRGESSREAKAVCATCPVAAQCLEHALDQPEIFGIWGETSERDRKRLRKASRVAA